MGRSEWATIATVVAIGGVDVWVTIVSFRWLTSRSWNAIRSQTDGGIHLTSEEGGITLTRDSEYKLMDIENPLQGFIHNEEEEDEEMDNYTIEEVEGDIISKLNIVEHRRHVTLSFALENISEADFEKWEHWRPKHHERPDTDLVETTAEQASLDETTGEQRGSPPLETFEIAVENRKAVVSIIDTANGTLELGLNAFIRGAYALWASGRKGLRAIESFVYRRLVTQVSPCYFDTELVSANLGRANRSTTTESYVFEVNINDDALAERIGDQLARFEATCEGECLYVERSDAFDEIADESGIRDGPESEVTKIPITETTERPYLCRRCERTFEVRYHVCPNCGGYDIQRRKWCTPTDSTQ